MEVHHCEKKATGSAPHYKDCILSFCLSVMGKTAETALGTGTLS